MTWNPKPDQKIWESSSEKIGMIYALSRTSYLINTIQASVTFNRHLCDQLQQELSAVAKKCDHELYLDTKEDLRAISFMIDGVNSKISQARERSAALNSSVMSPLSVKPSQYKMLTLQKFYNTISQIDNQLNYQIAKATRMDSYDMRAIALLTTFFLPGTFVAVSVNFTPDSYGPSNLRISQAFFSSGVFTFESSDSSIVQKTPMWIYWAITIPLTFVVVTSWMFWSKNHKKRDKDEAFGAKETDNRGKGGGNDASGGTGGQRGGDGGDGSGNGNGTGSGANANAAGWRSRVRARFKARGTQGQGGIDLDMYTTV